MSEQTFPLSDFNDLESSVRNITQQPKPQKQQARPQEQQMPQEADACKQDWIIRDVMEKYLKDGIARYEQKHGAVTKQQRNIDDIL